MTNQNEKEINKKQINNKEKNINNTKKSNNNNLKKKSSNKSAQTMILVILSTVIVFGIFAIILLAKDVFKDDSNNGTNGNGGEKTTEATTVPDIHDFVGNNDIKGVVENVDAYIYGMSLCISGKLMYDDVDTNKIELNENESNDNESNTEELDNVENATQSAEVSKKNYEKMYFVIRRAYTNNDGSVAADYKEFPAYFEVTEEGIVFKSFDKINNGINLEIRDNEEYVLVLKGVCEDGTTDLYSLNMDESIGELKYYTLTKDGKNCLVDMKNESSKDGVGYFYMSIEDTTLPENVYDVVIDPGHGGNDPGACNGDYCEAVTMLDYAKSLKNELEKLGYKVLLTRDGSESSDEWMAYTMYDENGRVNKAAGSNAKYCFSLHMNSNEIKLTNGGIQVYHSYRADMSFAKHMVDSIVEKSGTHYSPMSAFKEVDGVYCRAYSQGDINENVAGARRDGYEPYPVTTDTDYYFMIRELGGVATNAYVDGRNPKYGSNNFRNTRNGVEAIICELGFISVDEDLEHILANKNLYIEGLVEGFSSYINE